jgi:VWFA-related protein
MFKHALANLSCAIAAITVAAALVLPQSGRRLPSRSHQEGDQVLRLQADEVLLNITVTNEFGRLAPDLRKDEFIIAEDGVRQDIASFFVSTIPVNVVLLLDASGSVMGELSFLRDAATHFVDELKPEDKVSAIEFHAKVEMIQDWTSSRDDLRHAISWRFKPGALPKKGGNTSLYDALFLAVDEQLVKVEGRKAIIILTDCLDTSSKLSYEKALASVVRSGAVVYVVSKARAFIAQMNEHRTGLGRVLAPGNARIAGIIAADLERAERMMADVCEKTGGQIYSPMSDDEMKEVYGQVARELKNQYVVTYLPKNEVRDGGLRQVRAYLTRSGYKARTRDSYYAPRD